MDTFEEIERDYDASETLRTFSLPESKAAIDLAFLAVMIDRNVTAEELDALRQQLEHLPFATKQQAKEALSDHIDRTQRAVAEMLDSDMSIDHFIADRTDSIQGAEGRRATLELLSIVSFADRPHPSEADTFFRVGESFGYSRDELEEIWVGHER